jgi:dihydrofolate reductase
MQVSIVVAVAEDGAIGRAGTLPWRLPSDLQYFKQMTMGKPVIMGRRTWEERNGKPLKGRLNIVVSQNLKQATEGVLICRSLPEAFDAVATHGYQEAAVIGGASLFAEAVPCANVLHITRVHTKVPDADTFFPGIDLSPFRLAWEEAHEADERNEHAFTFQRWERKQQ